MHNQFVIRTPTHIVLIHLGLGIPLLVMGIGMTLTELKGAYDTLNGVMILIPGAGLTLRGLVLAFWKCTVEGKHISVRSLFRRKEITFSDIKRVVPVAHANEDGPTDLFKGINLYSEAGKLFHIHGSKDGFAAFVICLKEQNIPGVTDLPKGIKWR